MKTFTIILTFLVLLSGCADKNAFSRFNMSEKQELSANALQRSKIKFNEKVNGIISIVYLNIIDPKKYNDGEYFYAYTYIKNKNYESNFVLKNQEPMTVEELSSSNTFSSLTSINNKWNKYYLLKFAKQSDKLSFVFENGPYSSDTLKFEKDE